ncbi:unnamed protein product [Schistocephalus solidus]|uniref:VWFA domain-containing protein n=1 Tax=Schistocephalus solidus TaxID=70667 RepID=A0A183SJ71_SCHSO|nr:unnamed protein product [Schistocephalus solidus]
MWKVQLADLKLDFFDCRSTLWYVGAASYPMEMVIIVDKSGSMKGRRNTISNATLVELLNTLTENDFFNVIYVSQPIFWPFRTNISWSCYIATQKTILECICLIFATLASLQFSEIIRFAEPTIQDRLIQATKPNKDRIIRSFAKHAPNGTANFQAAWTAAFTLLNLKNETRISQCNRVIMLITDGAPEEFTELFEKFNPEKNVRVFVYLLGQHSADDTIVQRIACQNRGNYIFNGHAKEYLLTNDSQISPSMKVLNPQLTNPAESCEVDTSLPYGAKLSPVKFCKFGNDLLHIFMRDPICALKEVLLDSKSRKENKCDEQHIAEIFVDAQATSSIYNHWKNLEGQAVINMFGIQQVFSMHQPGLIRFYNFTQPTYVRQRVTISFLSMHSLEIAPANFSAFYFRNFLKEHEAGVEDALYSSTVLRSTFYENYKMLVFSPPPRQVFRFFLEKDISVPMTVTTVVSHPAVESVPLAVSGAQITYQKLVELFYSIVNSCRGSGCLRCNDTGVHCYITTENGQIIVSTQGEKAVACFPFLPILFRREFYDFQAICIEAVIPEINFASRLFSFSFANFDSRDHFDLNVGGFINTTLLFAANVWHDLPHLSGGLEDYPTLNPVEKPNSENAPYAYGSQSRDESDFGFANQLRQDRTENDPMLPPAFYGDYEVLKLTDTPQEPRFLQEKPNLPTKNKGDSNNFKGRRPNVSKGPKPAVTTPLGETTSSTEMNEFAFPFGGGAAEGYNFNEPDDPWLMQQQAFSELNACFINEPTLVLGKSPASMPSVSAGTEETTMDMGTMFSEKEDIQLRGVPGLNNTVVNYTKPAKTVSRGPIVPGSLLRCIQRVVQMRCHAAGHSSNMIGRQACEVMCEAVRQRMSQLIAFLHDCRQPLDSCTQRYSVFFLNREAYAGTQVSEAKHGPKTYGKKYQKKTERSKPMGRETPQLQPKIHSGTYCLACGNADWVVSSIPDSNLLLVVTAMASEGAAVNCNCGCMRRYRYGTRVKDILLIYRLTSLPIWSKMILYFLFTALCDRLHRICSAICL